MPGAGQPLLRPAGGQAGEGLRAVDEGTGQAGQAQVAGPGEATQEAECLVHVQAETLGEYALGLLDDDPAVQRGLQLLSEDFTVAHAALVQQADGGDVGQGLADAYVRGVERTRGQRSAPVVRSVTVTGWPVR